MNEAIEGTSPVMYTEPENSKTIMELQAEVVAMRKYYPEQIRKRIKRLNKMKINILENADYSTDIEQVEIPAFPFDKYEQIFSEDKKEQQEMKTKLKEEIIIMQTILKRKKCPVAQLLKE